MKLINKLPKYYDELPLNKYIKIIDSIPAEKPDDWTTEDWNVNFYYVILSILLDLNTDNLKGLSVSEVTEMIKVLSFLDKPLEGRKRALKLKGVNDITYDEFINYNKLRLDFWKNAADVLKIFIKDKTKEEIETMSVQEVADTFFMLKRSIKKYLKRSLTSLLLTIVKQKIRRIFKKKAV